jgi:hypothetical protein
LNGDNLTTLAEFAEHSVYDDRISLYGYWASADAVEQAFTFAWELYQSKYYFVLDAAAFEAQSGGKKGYFQPAGIGSTDGYSYSFDANANIMRLEIEINTADDIIAPYKLGADWLLDGGDVFRLTYDGVPHTVSAVLTGGFVANETVTILEIADGYKTNAGEYTAVIVLEDGANGGKVSNYKIDSIEWTIEKATLTGLNPLTVTYGATLAETAAAVTASGVLGQSEVAGTVTWISDAPSGYPTFADGNYGEGKEYSVVFNDADGNYNEGQFTLVLTVLRRELILVWAVDGNTAYDGDYIIEYDGQTHTLAAMFANIVEGDEAPIITYDDDKAYKKTAKNVGQYIIALQSVQGASNENYMFSPDPSLYQRNWEIAQRILTVSAKSADEIGADKLSKIYDGTMLPAQALTSLYDYLNIGNFADGEGDGRQS